MYDCQQCIDQAVNYASACPDSFDQWKTDNNVLSVARSCEYPSTQYALNKFQCAEPVENYELGRCGDRGEGGPYNYTGVL